MNGVPGFVQGNEPSFIPAFLDFVPNNRQNYII